MKLFLIDAYALIYRSYYAFIKNPRINSKGMNTSAIFGFINSLEDVLKRENPTHIAVGFDPKGPTFRHEAYEQYKAQRQETPEDIRKSVPFIKDIIEAYNIPILEVPRYEADDVIGTVAKQAEKEGFEVYMMTPDKDYGQLVSEHIFMYRPRFGGDGQRSWRPFRPDRRYLRPLLHHQGYGKRHWVEPFPADHTDAWRRIVGGFATLPGNLLHGFFTCKALRITVS